jgi:Resolvase, N terminal domain
VAKRPIAGRCLFYTRDSGGEHENTPGEYVGWCQRCATQSKLTFSGTPAKILAMIRDGRYHDGDLFLDYGVKGNQLQRAGLDALLRAALTDQAVSHVFIPRRDRFARPDDPIDALKLEARFREAGVTLVFMDRTLAPLPRGRRDLGESIAAMIDYDRAGKERRDLAQKIIYAQLTLAKAGFSTGGRPPYGFRRWLVRGDGTTVRQLAEGEHVKMAGHHVLWLPGPDEERAVIYRILDLLETMPASRVAALLTSEGVPTPDAGRLRTDKGVKHPTSGVWGQQQVGAVARNPLLRAVVEYGRRSMGDVLRFSPQGPRELEEGDLRADGKARVVSNPESVCVKAAARFDALVEPERHARLLAKLDERGGTQRGKPRAQDPARNPLGGLIFDMGCGWPLYRQPIKDSFNYTCGLYQQSHGAQCKHNHVDGVLATRFLLGCVRQRVLAPELNRELEGRVRAIAEREKAQPRGDADLAGRRTELAALRAKRERAGQNLALAEGPEQYRAVAATFDQLRKQEEALEAEVSRLQQTVGATQNLEAEVAAAMNGLTRLADLASVRQDLASIGQLFRQINARIFFRFTESRWKKRIVNKLAGGVVTFGETPAPVSLYEGPTGRRYVKSLAAPEGAVGLCSQEPPEEPALSTGKEGDSLGNVCRGERIRTSDLLNPIQAR